MLSEELALRITGDASSANAAVRQLQTTIRQVVGETKNLSGVWMPDQDGVMRLSALSGGLKDVDASAKDAGLGLSGAWTMLRGFAGTLGIGLGIGAVVSFTKGIVTTASETVNLSKMMSVSTDTVQRWKFAAEQAGDTIGEVANAVTILKQKLAEGSPSTIEALRDAGLEFEVIREMRMEDALLAIAEAAAKIEDPIDQAAFMTELLGARSQKILPVIVGGLKEVGDGATIMSKEAVEAWDRLGNAVSRYWVTFKAFVTNTSGAALAFFQADVDQQKHLADVIVEVNRLRTERPDLSPSARQWMAEEIVSTREMTTRVMGLTDAREKSIVASRQQRDIMGSLRLDTDAITTSLGREIEATDRQTKLEDAHRLALVKTRKELELLPNAWTTLRKAVDDWQDSWPQPQDVLPVLRDGQKATESWFHMVKGGRGDWEDITAEIKRVDVEIRDLAPATRTFRQHLGESLSHINGLSSGLGTLGDILHSRILTSAARVLDTFTQTIGAVEQIVDFVKGLPDLLDNVSEMASGIGKALGIGSAAAGGGSGAGVGTGAGAGMSAGASTALLAGSVLAAPILAAWYLSTHDIDSKIRKEGGTPVSPNSVGMAKYKELIEDQNLRGRPFGLPQTGGLKAEQLQHILAWKQGGKVGPIPAFRDGGMDDFGAGRLAVMHAREAAVPLDRIGQFMNAAEKAAFGRARSAQGDSAPPQLLVDARGAFFLDYSTLEKLADMVSGRLSDRFHQLYPVRA